MSNPEEERIREEFRKLRERDEASAPAFERTWRRASERVEKRSPRGLWIAAAAGFCGVMLMGIGLATTRTRGMASAPAVPQAAMVPLAEESSALEFLLPRQEKRSPDFDRDLSADLGRRMPMGFE